MFHASLTRRHHVGPIDLHDVLLDIRAAQHVGLGPVVGGEVAGRHPRSDLEGVGQVAPGRERQRAQEIAGDIDGLNRLVRFEQRRVAAHDNALLHAPERENDIEREVEPGPDFDALPRVLREARQLRNDVEDARREIQEAVLAISLADTDVRAGNGRAHRGDRDPWQYSAFGVADHTPHGAFTGDLRVYRCCRHQHQQGNHLQSPWHRCIRIIAVLIIYLARSLTVGFCGTPAPATTSARPGPHRRSTIHISAPSTTSASRTDETPFLPDAQPAGSNAPPVASVGLSTQIGAEAAAALSVEEREKATYIIRRGRHDASGRKRE